MKMSKPPFLKQPPILPTLPFLWENSEPFSFWKISKTQIPSFVKEGGGVPKMISH